MHDDSSIHDEPLKRFNQVLMTARFPRILVNRTPRCMLFKLSDDQCLFPNFTQICLS